ncbi:MAG: nucleoside hydrolase [Chloroflexota bacterium]
MAQKIILDVDTGTDDAVALMTAALSPEIELVGATTVNGNCPVDICTENTLRVFDYIGVDIPVHQGHSLPLVSTLNPARRPDIPRIEPSQVHGHYLDIPPATSKVQAQHAVDWLIDTYMASDGDIILVPVGPLTNIAAAIRKEPRILEKIPELVIMGGGHKIGNVTPSAEFNIWVDPEAARIVMNCGRPIRLITLDATHQALFSKETCAQLREIGTPAAIASAIMTEHRIAAYSEFQPMKEHLSAPVHDALNIIAIIDPSVIETVFVNVDVETQGELTDGRTVCDVHQRSGKAPNAHVALAADGEKFVRMMLDILGPSAG